MEKNKKERATARATQSQNHKDNTTKKPQWQVVRDELIDHEQDGITSWDMISRHHITRTAAHIATLKKMGYEISSVNETNNGVTYSRYFLVDEEEIEDEEEDEEDGDNIDALIEEIWEATGKWVSPERLEARAKYDAQCTWRNTRGW